MPNTFEIVPTVDQAREFLEIANDFANPLELVREAISNAYDAKASRVRIKFYTENEYGEDVFIVFVEDDGVGMDRHSLQTFFDLGNSTRRNNNDAIGEKGHGTKVYFNSKEIKVETSLGGDNYLYVATMKDPKKYLYENKVPKVLVEEHENNNNWNGTKIWIKEYNYNRRDKFTHERVKDYIQWFTKFGSAEKQFGINDNIDKKVILQGIDSCVEEEMAFGHVFPSENKNVDSLFEKHSILAPKYYVRRWIRSGSLPSYPDKRYQAVFYVEGDNAKREQNKMLRRPGYTAPEGAYTVRERYGLWLCKDFIPIEQKNEWIVTKGTEFVRFHAFFNLQGFKLTANRGSVQNTPSEIMKDVESVVKKIYKDITESDDWSNLEFLEKESFGEITKEKEKADFNRRLDRSKRVRVADYKGHTLIEPIVDSKYCFEQGVYALFLIINILEPELFPFEIVDYNTHEGIDVIAKCRSDVSLDRSHLFYIEFKGKLIKELNHSFKYLYSIVCWDTDILNGAFVTDLSGKQRTMHIISITDKSNNDGYTKYFLDDPSSPHKIEVFVLKDYLRDKLGLEFRPR